MHTGHPARATCCCCYGISEFLVVAVTHHHEPSGLNSTRLPSELEDGSLQAASLRWGAVVSRAGSSGGLREGHIPSLPASGGCLRSWALALPPSPERVPSVSAGHCPVALSSRCDSSRLPPPSCCASPQLHLAWISVVWVFLTYFILVFVFTKYCLVKGI